MREGTFIEEWLNEKLEQGLQQGLQQGERRQSEAILTRILARRFGRLPPGLVKRLALLTVVQMEALVDAALDAQDLAAFERAWASMETANWVGIVAQRGN
jgi:flagellar biosynthesis/type III secretory pathway protein FliH